MGSFSDGARNPTLRCGTLLLAKHKLGHVLFLDDNGPYDASGFGNEKRSLHDHCLGYIQAGRDFAGVVLIP